MLKRPLERTPGLIKNVFKSKQMHDTLLSKFLIFFIESNKKVLKVKSGQL